MSLRLVVLASGNGSNLQAILDACGQGNDTPQPGINAEVVGVLSNRANAYCLVRAQQADIATALIEHTDYPEREHFDAAMQQVIDAWQPDLVILAGFMRILTPAFVEHYQHRLINIHPSLLPKYKGLHTHQRALEAGDSEHGCSVHLVNAELDGGPVLAQMVVPVLSTDNPETLAQRVHQAEHLIYPEVISWFTNQRLQLKQGQLTLDGEPLAHGRRQYLPMP